MTSSGVGSGSERPAGVTGRLPTSGCRYWPMVTASTPAAAQALRTSSTSAARSPSPTMRPLLTSGRARAAPAGAALARPLVKSGLMVGLGERAAEVEEVLSACAAAGVDAVTIGQYLQPDAGCLPVARYVEPTEFASYEKRGAAATCKPRA